VQEVGGRCPALGIHTWGSSYVLGPIQTLRIIQELTNECMFVGDHIADHGQSPRLVVLYVLGL